MNATILTYLRAKLNFDSIDPRYDLLPVYRRTSCISTYRKNNYITVVMFIFTTIKTSTYVSTLFMVKSNHFLQSNLNPDYPSSTMKTTRRRNLSLLTLVLTHCRNVSSFTPSAAVSRKVSELNLALNLPFFANENKSDDKSGKTNVIAGATGYIGKSTVRESVRQGYNTIALVRDVKKVDSPEGQALYGQFFEGAKVVECDVCDIESLTKVGTNECLSHASTYLSSFKKPRLYSGKKISDEKPVLSNVF